MNRFLSVLVIAALCPLLVPSACAESEGGSGSGATGGGAVGGKDAGPDSAVGGTGGTGGTVSGGTGGTGGSAGSDGAAGSGGAADAAPPISVSGRLVDLLSSANDAGATPVVGAQICVFENKGIPCVTTNATGDFTLAGVPSNAEVLIELTKNDYYPTLVTVTTGTGPISFGEMLAPSKQAVALLAFAVNVTLDPTKGQVLFNAFNGTPGFYSGEPNVSALLTPKSGVGPYYFDAAGQPDKALTATTTSGTGVFTNVDPGTAEVGLTHFSKTCKLIGTAWKGSTATSAKIKVVAGYLTGGAAIECP